VIALLAGEPPVAVALLTLRPNVWYEGQVALLDELYVAPVPGAGGDQLAQLEIEFEDAPRWRHGYDPATPAGSFSSAIPRLMPCPSSRYARWTSGSVVRLTTYSPGCRAAPILSAGALAAGTASSELGRPPIRAA